MNDFLFLIKTFISQESYDSLVINCCRFLVDNGCTITFAENGMFLNGNIITDNNNTRIEDIDQQILLATIKMCEEMNDPKNDTELDG
ncbi:MAG: hypothetical protein PHD05_00370 [Sphaerochaetaceae bacterium]|nr:hypothetical protein [Sphaerochaetaceae bacterium]